MKANQPSHFGQSIAVFILALLVVSIRNLDPILHPVLYAEDGIWLSSGLEHGWIYTLTQARPDYPVAIQVALLWLASTISGLVSGNAIIFAPQIIVILAWMSLAALSTLVFRVTRLLMDVKFAALLALILTALPAGATSNEIYGRFLQLGFLVPVLGFCLVHILVTTPHQGAKIVIYQALLLACIVTNPIAGFLIVAQFLVTCCYAEEVDDRRRILSIAGTSIGGALVALVYLGASIGRGSSLPGEFEPSGFIAAFIGRALLYPFTYFAYSRFSDFITITVFIGWLAIVIFALIKSSRKMRLMLVSLLVVLVVWDVLTFVGRPSLTQFALDYNSSFPDRYYLGLNALSATLTFMSIYELLRGFKLKFSQKTVRGIFAVMVGIFFMIFSYTIYEPTPRMPISDKSKVFISQLCSAKSDGEGQIQVPIYPAGWEIHISDSYKHGCDER